MLALITGATGGLGSALAHLMARKGIPLLLTGRDPKKLEQLGKELDAEVYVADLRDRDGLLEWIRAKAPDLIINNAGYTFYGDCLSYSIAEELDILEVNAKAVLEITLTAAANLKQQNRTGVILNISSAAAEFSFPGMAVYAASKAFVTSFSRSFHAEMKPFGIHILTCLPGQIDTEFAARAAKKRSLRPQKFSIPVEKAAEEIWRQICSKQPIRVIDWRYRVMLWVARCLPKRLFEGALYREIKLRILLTNYLR